MKNLILGLVFAFSGFAFAAVELGGEVNRGGVGVISTATESAVVPTERSNFMEGGMQYSSMNEGTAFATVAIVHEWRNGFALGLRGLLPMSFSKQAQAYMGQILMRFNVLNEGDQIYLEPTITQGYFNGIQYGRMFGGAGFNVGYTHNIKKLWSLGAQIGVDFSPARISGDEMTDRSTLYNKVALTGSYYF